MVLDAMILSLGLSDKEAAYMKDLHSGQNNQLRLLQYSPLLEEVLKDKDQARLGEHKDAGYVQCCIAITRYAETV